MSEKVVAEGSLWMIESDLSDAEFARLSGAVKITTITPTVRRVYFLPGTTPDEGAFAGSVGADKATIVVRPEHVAQVTPTGGSNK